MQKYEWLNQADYDSIADPSWPTYHDFVSGVDIPDYIVDEVNNMLAPPSDFDHPSFCVDPFYTMEWPLELDCCLLPKDVDIEKVRTQMLNGERPEECYKCWNLEDAGIQSDRILRNASLDYWSNTDIHTLYEQAVKGKYSKIIHKVASSNRCNSTCVTCDAHSSTSWINLYKNNNIIATDKKWTKSKSYFDNKINYKTVKILTFTGGESLLSNTNFDILQSLLDEDNTDCFIGFVTNGSVRPTKRQAEMLKNFSNLNFSFSIDGINSVFEYVRYPLKWNIIVDNVKWAQDEQFDVSSCYTLSNINILNHWETLDWFNSMNMNYLVNPVYEPEIYSPGNINDDIKKQLDNIKQDNSLDCWIETEFNQTLFDKFVADIHNQDRLKNININNYIPSLGI